MAAPMQNRSHGHNLASSTISSRVILNFPLLYFTEVLLLGAIKGLKQKALTVGAVQGLCFLSSERLYCSLHARAPSPALMRRKSVERANFISPKLCTKEASAARRGSGKGTLTRRSTAARASVKSCRSSRSHAEWSTV